MGLLKFISFEIGIVLLVTLLSAAIGVFGFGYTDPKFGSWGNIGVRILLAAIAVVFVVGAIAGVLHATKHFPISPKTAAVFALIFGVYLEAFRLMADRHGWSTGSMWLPIISMIVVPAIFGVVFFLRLE